MDLGKLSELSVRRKCLECGAVFETSAEASALQQFSNHVIIHQPTGEQWKKAYETIQLNRPKRFGEAQ